MKKLIKLWRHMALRGKLLSVALLILFCALIAGIGVGIYNLPVFTQNRAVAAVDALYKDNGADLADGVAQNTGLISQATQKVNRLSSGGLRDYLTGRIETAQQMADCEVGLAALYETDDSGNKVPVKNIQSFQIENLDKTLKALDDKGKTEFTARIRQEMTEARAQYDQVSAINQAIDALFEDGSSRKTLREDVTNADCDAIDAQIEAIENPDLQKEMTFAFVDIKKAVAQQVEDQEALQEAEEEEQRQEEESAQQTDEADKSFTEKLWDSFMGLFRSE